MLTDDSVPGNPVVPELNGTHGLTGDIRGSEVPELLAIHTVFLREHNRVVNQIVQALGRDPRAQDVYFVFERAREIVIAETQNIVYGEYLEVLLGSHAMKWPKKRPLSLAIRQEYQANVNPSILNEFSTAAFRFGHSMMAGVNQKFDLSRDPKWIKNYTLSKNFFNTSEFSEEDNLGLEHILM